MRALGTTRHVASALTLAGAALAALTLVSSATAVQPKDKCLVVNQRSDARYPTLQAANDAAQTLARDTVVIKGTCVGKAILSKSINIAGKSTPALGIATLDGGGDGTVVTVPPGLAVFISGVTITGGNGDSSSEIHWNGNSGGGIFNSGSLTLSNVVVRDNTAGNGGGIYNNLGSLTVMDSVIADNTANSEEAPFEFVSYQGGGIFNGGCHPYISCPSQASITLASSLVASNTGGGIVNGYAGSLSLDGVTVAQNTAVYGAGIQSRGQVSVSESAVVDNAAEDAGGGVFVGRFGYVTITDSTVSGNRAGNSGGGLAGLLGGLHLNGTTVSGNTAASVGGGISNVGGWTELVGSAVTGNRVTSPNGRGGGIYSEDAGLTLEGSTVTGNIPDDIFYGPL